MENKVIKEDSLEFIKKIDNEKITVSFFDPQYRGVLDKLNYGSSKRMKKRQELPQMTEEYIIKCIKEQYRVLKPSGYLFLWIDKFHLLNSIANWIKDTDFQVVDMITWNKLKIGMGYRTRRKSEYLIILQKKPIKVKDTWTIHNIPDVWEEKQTKEHPHSKPKELQKQLIKSTTDKDSYILDITSGSGIVKNICDDLKLNFLGCDIIFGEKEKEED